MTDTTTNKPIRVSALGAPRPCIAVPVSQLDQVRLILDGAGVRYDVGEDTISLNGSPPVLYIYLRRGTDPKTVQDLLDRH